MDNAKEENKETLNSLKAAIEARRRAEDNIKSAIRPLYKTSDIIAQQLKAVENARRTAYASSHITEMARQLEQQRQLYADLTSPFKNIRIPDYTAGIKDLIKGLNLTNHISETMKQFRDVSDIKNKIFKGILEEQHEAQKRIIDALKPSFVDVRKHLALEFSHINNWQDSFQSIAESIKDFRPSIKVLRDTLVIEEEKFSRDDINRIAEEYIWDENSDKNIFKPEAKSLSWDNTPKPIRWLIALIIATVFTIYFTAIWKEATKDSILDPESVARKLVHFRKKEVRKITKTLPNETSPTFVNIEHLLVHKSPRKRSHAFAVLSYPCEIKILKYKHKKRWMLIEWKDENGKATQGWVLGRFVYRKINIKEKQGRDF